MNLKNTVFTEMMKVVFYYKKMLCLCFFTASLLGGAVVTLASEEEDYKNGLFDIIRSENITKSDYRFWEKLKDGHDKQYGFNSMTDQHGNNILHVIIQEKKWELLQAILHAGLFGELSTQENKKQQTCIDLMARCNDRRLNVEMRKCQLFVSDHSLIVNAFFDKSATGHEWQEQIIESALSQKDYKNNGILCILSALEKDDTLFNKLLAQDAVDVFFKTKDENQNLLHVIMHRGNVGKLTAFVNEVIAKDNCRRFRELLNEEDFYFKKPFDYLIGSESLTMLNVLKSNREQLGLGDEFFYPAVLSAAKEGRLELLKDMDEWLNIKADSIEEDRYGRSPLQLAVEFGQLEVVKFLVENNVDISHVDKMNRNVLHTAAGSNTSVNCASYLIENISIKTLGSLLAKKASFDYAPFFSLLPGLRKEELQTPYVYGEGFDRQEQSWPRENTWFLVLDTSFNSNRLTEHKQAYSQPSLNPHNCSVPCQVIKSGDGRYPNNQKYYELMETVVKKNIYKPQDSTPLETAIRSKNKKVAQLLVKKIGTLDDEKKADIYQARNSNDLTPLMTAISADQKSLVGDIVGQMSKIEKKDIKKMEEMIKYESWDQELLVLIKTSKMGYKKLAIQSFCNFIRNEWVSMSSCEELHSQLKVRIRTLLFDLWLSPEIAFDRTKIYKKNICSQCSKAFFRLQENQEDNRKPKDDFKEEITNLAETLDDVKDEGKAINDKLKTMLSLVKSHITDSKTLTYSELNTCQCETPSYNPDNGANSCEVIWEIPDYTWRKEESRSSLNNTCNYNFCSPAFYTSKKGYQMCLRAYPNGDGMGKSTHMSLYITLMKGDNDNERLDDTETSERWPFSKQITFTLLSDAKEIEVCKSFKADPTSTSFQRPVKDMNISSGEPLFVALEKLEGCVSEDDKVLIMGKIESPDFTALEDSFMLDLLLNENITNDSYNDSDVEYSE